MHLAPDQLVFGLVAPVLLIDCARQLHEENRDFTLDGFCRALGAPPEEAEPVLAQFVAEGFATEEGQGVFTPTQKLGQLALAKISNGLPREDADRLLDAILAKAHAINAHPGEKYCPISCLAVFGSYLGKQAILGDLDLAVALGVDPDDQPPRADQSVRQWLREGLAKNRHTYAALRLRRPQLISVHALEEVLGMGTPYRVIFGSLPSDPRNDAPSMNPAMRNIMSTSVTKE